jgi:hypothetical protein
VKKDDCVSVVALKQRDQFQQSALIAKDSAKLVIGDVQTFDRSASQWDPKSANLVVFVEGALEPY